jgi:hypothetical protein
MIPTGKNIGFDLIFKGKNAEEKKVRKTHI